MSGSSGESGGTAAPRWRGYVMSNSLTEEMRRAANQENNNIRKYE